MAPPEDFSPIAEQGELDPPPGLFAIVARRPALPSVAAGFRLVEVGKDGKPLDTGKRASSGERRNAGARSWVKVDVREHVLERKVPFQEPSGSAGFVATVTLTCTVADATEVAALGIAGVSGVVAGVLDNATDDIAANLKPLGVDDPLTALNESRIAAERALQKHLPGKADGLHSGWLDTEVKSVAVAFDAKTEQLHAELVNRSQKTQIFTADAKHQKLEAAHEIDLRKQWRDALGKYLEAPGTRAIELVLEDPSQENIAKVVNHLNDIEGARQKQVYDVLSSLIAKDYVHDPDELPKLMETIVEAVQWKLPSLGQGDGPPAQLKDPADGDPDEGKDNKRDDHDDDEADG